YCEALESLRNPPPVVLYTQYEEVLRRDPNQHDVRLKLIVLQINRLLRFADALKNIKLLLDDPNAPGKANPAPVWLPEVELLSARCHHIRDDSRVVRSNEDQQAKADKLEAEDYYKRAIEHAKAQKQVLLDAYDGYASLLRFKMTK